MFEHRTFVARRRLPVTLLLVAILAGFAGGLASGPTTASASCEADSPSIVSDKDSYGGMETAILTGEGFDCGVTLTIKITMPDGQVLTGDGTGTPGSDTVVSDEHGAFTYEYQLFGEYPDGTPYVGQEDEYKVEVLNASGTVLATTTFTDTHFRGGHMTWREVGPNEVEITVTRSYRRSYPVSVFRNFDNPDNNLLPGDTLSYQNIFLGDGTFATLHAEVIFVDIEDDWLLAEAKVNHTYSGPNNNGNPWVAHTQSCCRLSGLGNASDTQYRMQTTIDMEQDTSGAPVSQMTAIVDCPDGGTCTFNVPGAQPDNHDVTYSLAAAAEAGPGYVSPPGASIDASTGLFSLDTGGKAEGSLWTTHVVIEDRDSSGNILSTSQIEFITRIVDNVTPPVFDVPPSPSSGATLGVSAGQTVTFDIQASDPDGPALELDVIGLPPGATFPTPGTGDEFERSSTFTWTPPANQVGAHSIIFLATDGMATVTHAVSINVSVLHLDKTAAVVSGPNPPEDGSTTEYDLTMTVSLPSDAPSPVDDIAVSDTIGADATFVSLGNASQGTLDEDDGELSWDVGTLEPGGTADATFRVSVSPTETDIGNTLELNAAASATGVGGATGVSVSAQAPGVSTETVEEMSNLPPAADAGGPYTVVEGSSVVLDGSGSSDPDGDIVSYEWDFDYDGETFTTNETGVDPAFNAAPSSGPDTVTIALRVTDDGGLTDLATTMVTILATYELNIVVDGSGTVTADPDEAAYVQDTTVNLEATADVGWEFSHWEDDVTGTDAETSVTMDGPKTVTAVFTQLTPEEFIAAILVFFDKGMAEGTLAGSGPGDSGDGRANAFRNMLLSAENGIQGPGGNTCTQLQNAYLRTDGSSNPPAFVEGDAAEELEEMIGALMEQLGCV